MKAQKKNTKPSVESTESSDILANFDFKKYSGPEFAPPKLKDIEEKFKKQAELRAKQVVHH